MRSFPSGPPRHTPQPKSPQVPAPPPAKQRDSQVRPILNEDLVALTRHDVIFVTLALTQIDARLNAILASQPKSSEDPVDSTDVPSQCTSVLARSIQTWKQLAREYWGVGEEPLFRLPAPATVNKTQSTIAELVQILLVEGALLFGRAEFDTMERVRRLIESCTSIQSELQQLERDLNL